MLLLWRSLFGVRSFLDVDDEFGFCLVLVDGSRGVMDLVAINVETTAGLPGP